LIELARSPIPKDRDIIDAIRLLFLIRSYKVLGLVLLINEAENSSQKQGIARSNLQNMPKKIFSLIL